jgi:hypothetical protein
MKSVNKPYFFSLILIFLLLFFVFPFLFSSNSISGGDYINFSQDTLLVFKSNTFAAWDSNINLGWSTVGLMHYAPYSYFIALVGTLAQYHNNIWERLVWWLPFFIFSFFSTHQLFKLIYPKNSFWFLSPLIFVFNTYILMILGGGQISGIGLAYAIAPLVLARFIKVANSHQVESYKVIRSSIIAGLVFSGQVMFDLRIAYITLLAVGLYVVLKLLGDKVIKGHLLKSLVLILTPLAIPLTITGLLHIFWLLPMLLFKVNTIEQLGSAYSSLTAVQFFSFAKLENTISLLHPNWPENLFGKVYFMKAEFLILPILAYASLLFVGKTKSSSHILFFALLGLLGAFLAKGANEPFGQIYLWMFDHVPGFVMFRDPTKWYLLVAISYSVLIPFSIFNIYKFLSTCTKFFPRFLRDKIIFNFQFSVKSKIFNFQNLFLLLVTCCLLFLIHPALLGQLGGTFKQREVPSEYTELKDKLITDKDFYRTLWVPVKQSYGFISSNHPGIYAQDFFQTNDITGIVSSLSKPRTPELLSEASVKYVIVPFDSEKEIFIKDRKYDERQYGETIKELQRIKWLHPISIPQNCELRMENCEFGRIAVFEVEGYKDHFYLINNSLIAHDTVIRNQQSNNQIKYTFINPAKYKVSVKDGKKGDVLVFSESFDSGWKARQGEEILDPSPYTLTPHISLNSFVLPEDGNYDLEVYYQPQQWVDIGVWISLATLVMVIGYLVIVSSSRKS